MSLFRVLLAGFAAAAIAIPAYAADSSSTTTGTDTGTEQTTTQTKINLNTATAKELMTVKGINAPKARAILAYRKKHGEFKTTDDLTNVKGFKKLNSTQLQSIQDQLTIE